ncbi:MAG: copper amine oxidase N-terminal domain-containing protein [Oscillospiraceae bacterium]|nr:copper amine oxidase N-terminal domain-containing protein [Oscillospiraceae bacterium]
MCKKAMLIIFALTFVLTSVLMSVGVPAFAATANPTSSAVFVDGRNIAFDAYLIDGFNYFKLRDLAYALNSTAKQFEVGWDGVNNFILLTSGQSYSSVGGEMTGKGDDTKEATPTDSRIYLDGGEVQFAAYYIDGNNYFKLRDIGEAFDFGVDWDGEKDTVVINTSKGYTQPTDSDGQVTTNDSNRTSSNTSKDNGDNGENNNNGANIANDIDNEVLIIQELVNKINNMHLIEDDIESYVYYEEPTTNRWYKIVARLDEYGPTERFLERDQVCEWYFDYDETPDRYTTLRLAYIHGGGFEERYYYKERKLIRYINSDGTTFDFHSETEIPAELLLKSSDINLQAELMFTN